jgi:hypothetical protein
VGLVGGRPYFLNNKLYNLKLSEFKKNHYYLFPTQKKEFDR